MKSKKVAKWAGIICLTLVGGALGYFAGKFGAATAQQLPTWMVVSLALFYIPAFFIVVALHEAGHALAGILVAFDFRMFVVGPFFWGREDNQWRFKWNKNLNVAGGMVICVPTGSENLRNRFITYAAAGPIASLLSAGIFWILYFLLDTLVENPVGIGQFVAYLLLTISLLSAAIFIATIIPLHAGGFSTDGARVLRLARGGDIGRFELLLIRIISSSMAGTRPSELSGEDLEEATALADKLNAPFGVYLRSFQFQSAFDKGDLDRAEAELQLYLERIDSIPAGIRGSVWLDAAFFYGFARRDLSQAASYFEKFKPAAIIPKSQIYATEAVMLALQNDQEKSQQVIKKAIRELPNVLDKGMAVALHERLLTLQHRLSTNSALVEV